MRKTTRGRKVVWEGVRKAKSWNKVRRGGRKDVLGRNVVRGRKMVVGGNAGRL